MDFKGIQMLDKSKNLWESNVNRTINKEVYFPFVIYLGLKSIYKKMTLNISVLMMDLVDYINELLDIVHYT